jgi:hypothetical protein
MPSAKSARRHKSAISRYSPVRPWRCELALSLVEHDAPAPRPADEDGWELDFNQDNAPSRRRLSDAERDVLTRLLQEPPRP